MKRRLLLSLFIGLIAIFTMAMSVSADGPGTVTVTWDGGGVVTGEVDTGDNVTSFGVNASLANGNFTCTDSNDNPYSYAVDTINSYIQSEFTGGGSTYYQVVRNDSYTSYGHCGQVAYSFIGSSDAGSMATGSRTNYASMVNATYGKPKTDGGFNFQASGADYLIQSFIASCAELQGGSWVATDNSAMLLGAGSGTMDINCMTNEASAGAVTLGAGGGCYTNANVTATGAGTFQVNATGCSNITTPVGGGWSVGGTGTYGSASMSIIANFNNGFTVGNYSVTVH